MAHRLQGFSLILGIMALVMCAGFLFQWDFITALSPWQIYASQSARLSEIFVASIWAAIAAPVIWIGIKGGVAASFGGAVNLSITFAGIGIFCVQLYLADNSRQPIFVFGIFSFMIVALLTFIGWQSWGLSFKDDHPTPTLVRLSFAFFALALLLTGSALICKVPNIFPWNLPEELQVIYGWIFLGAMCYFLFGVYMPKWSNAQGQLMGFLAYDLILIIPFVQHFETVAPEQSISLVIYVGVLFYSGALAVYYLFLNKATRFGSEQL